MREARMVWRERGEARRRGPVFVSLVCKRGAIFFLPHIFF